MAMAATTGRPFLAEAPSVVKLLGLYLRLVLLLDLLFVAVYVVKDAGWISLPAVGAAAPPAPG